MYGNVFPSTIKYPIVTLSMVHKYHQISFVSFGASYLSRDRKRTKFVLARRASDSLSDLDMDTEALHEAQHPGIFSKTARHS